MIELKITAKNEDGDCCVWYYIMPLEKSPGEYLFELPITLPSAGGRPITIQIQGAPARVSHLDNDAGALPDSSKGMTTFLGDQ